jgi:hypothetical protein
MFTPRYRLVTRLFAFSLFFASSGVLLHAQGLGTVTGTVADPSGGLVAAAAVRITDEGTSAVRDTTTNTQGYYIFTTLRPATYTLSVSARGFATSIRKGVVLQADQTVTVNAELTIQRASETVTVEAPPPQVDTSTSTLSEVVDQRRIIELPLNGRNAASLMLITAGTVLGPPGADEGNTKTFPVAQTISANGSRQNQTSFRLDGAMNNDIYTNVNQPFPFPDALQEFSVQTSNYSARYGGNAGGVVNIVTKSGTNELHGSLFEFVRNSEFNARSFFAATRDQYKRNQFGGTFGGPVVFPGIYNGRNRTFFFLGYQGTRIRNTGGGASATYPTAASLNGDFSGYLSSTLKSINDPATGQPFPNAQVPVSRFDPAAVALTKYLPVGAGSGLIFYGAPIAQSFNEMLSRVDHSFSDRDRFSARYFYDRYENTPFLDLKNYVNNSSFAVITSHSFALNETHAFSPSLVNDLHLGVAREVSNRGPAAGSINAADLGVKMYVPPGDKILESLSVSNFFSISQTDPATFTRTQYTLNDAISLVRGGHSLTFGIDATRGWVLIRNQFHQPGAWTFTGDYTGLSLADFLIGAQRTFLQGNGEFKDNRVNTFGLFIQDDWKASRRLTFNLGLRFDPFFPWKETQGRIEEFSPAAYAGGQRSQVFVNAPPGLLFPGDPGVPEYGVRGNMKNFGPRAGFAWDVAGDGKTSVRGGFGMFFDALQNGIYNNRFVDVTPYSLQINMSPATSPFSDPWRGYPGGNPFPAQYPPAKTFAFPATSNLVASYDVANGGQYQTPVTYGWNLTVERQLTPDWLARVAYVGSHASHLLETLQLSPVVPATKTRFFKEYSDIPMASQDINSGYQALQATIQKRMAKGFTVLANYTWSKSIDDLPFGASITTVVTGNQSALPWYMPGRHQFDRGPSEFDHKHRFVGSFVWDMPELGGSPAAVRYLLGGWQLTGLLSAQSGGPVTVEAGKDFSGTSLGRDRGVLVSDNVYGPGACAAIKTTCVDYLNPAAFTTPATGAFGNLGKGALRGPDMITYDGGLFKEIPLHRERVKLQFRAEYFNLFNRVNFYNPGATVSSSTNIQASSSTASAQVTASGFGSLRAAFDPRIGQLALKLTF